MKEIIETKLVEKTTHTFIAEDGKAFAVGEKYKTIEEANRECKIYEYQLNEKVMEERFQKMKPTYLFFPFVEWLGEKSIFKITLKTEDDFDFLVSYEEFQGGFYYENYIKEKRSMLTFPCTVVVVETDGYCDIETDIEKIKNELAEVSEKLSK